MPAVPKTCRWYSPAYRKYVASHSCLICGNPETQAAHVSFLSPVPRGLSSKVSDWYCVPLCVSCHREQHAANSERGWWQKGCWAHTDIMATPNDLIACQKWLMQATEQMLAHWLTEHMKVVKR